MCGQEAQDGFLNNAIPKLPDDARYLCEGEPTEEELRKAVMSMKNDKSAWNRRVDLRLLIAFLAFLGKNLTRVFHNAFLVRRLSVSQRRGIITLLLTKGDRILLKNWSPINLLTSDYEILTKALANILPFIYFLLGSRSPPCYLRSSEGEINRPLSHS